MHLCEILGSFATSIDLVQKRCRDIYYPTLTITNLVYNYDYFVMNYSKDFERMSRYTKESRKDKMAELLRSKSFFPWGRDVEHDTVLERLKELYRDEGDINYQSREILGLVVAYEPFLC